MQRLPLVKMANLARLRRAMNRRHSTVTGMGLLGRCHSYKDKIAGGIKPNHGLFAYPVLMTADILIMQGQKIPVGADQKQHLEVARDIAEKFNHTYGDIFTIPEPEIAKDVCLIPGTDGRKMSKSYDNTIQIFGSKEELKQRVMNIQTDSTPLDQPKPTEGNPLFLLYAAFLDKAGQRELTARFAKPGLGYGEIKKELVELIWNEFNPYRQAREDLLGSRGKVDKILARGAEKARAVAMKTMKEVRKAVGTDYKKA